MKITLVIAIALVAACEKSAPTADDPPSPPPTRDASPAPDDARDPLGAVELLRALCTRAKAGDDSWVAERVRLPLEGIHSLNAIDADPLVRPHDNAEVKDFKYTRYCLMLPPAGTALREHVVTADSATGLVDFGKVPHQVRFELGSGPPRLVTLDAQIPPTPIPARRRGVRPYTLGALPPGFTRNAPAGAAGLRRRVIKILRADPRCIDSYVAKDSAVVRFAVEVTATKPAAINVLPVQLVPISLIGCLRTQLKGNATLLRSRATRAAVEVLIPISAGDVPSDAPILRMSE